MAYYSSKNVLRLLKSFNTQWENGGFSPPCPGFRRSAFYIAEEWYVKNYMEPVLIEGGARFWENNPFKANACRVVGARSPARKHFVSFL